MTLRDIFQRAETLVYRVGQDFSSAASTSILDWPLYLVVLSGLGLMLFLILAVAVVQRYHDSLVRAGLLLGIWFILATVFVLIAVGFGVSPGLWVALVPTVIVVVLQLLAVKGRFN
ncbi:hypothetical protein [Pseudophaeobacter sp. EL27]|uniref:hypothetical protein n=1 Tax=Pseudophaeobacter sp. EL27 TaxID=2107580 RepID=UPI000EFD8C22|nr:hypothetical protein [Pseudophaeobacter sp. EL27]